jgi:uncharacterized glyoxalase superfamily protein PhnB
MTNRAQVSEVTVGLDPAATFAVFTGEIDYWWQRGPINNWDSARVREMRCEPGVGGRLLEIYDEAAGDMLELARITTWEPGARLAWRSSVDDIRIEVLFEPTDNGTRVSVHATLPPGGRDTGGTSFVRVTPTWFGRWCVDRMRQPHAVQETGRMGLAIYYADPHSAAGWLRDTFGFQPVLELGDEKNNAQPWIEFRVGNAPLMIFGRDGSDKPPARSHEPWVFVDDLGSHLASARRAGATVIEEVKQYGYRAYVAEDLEGHRWTFAQARPTMR